MRHCPAHFRSKILQIPARCRVGQLWTFMLTMAQLSARGRLYGREKALDIDLRGKIIQDIIEIGGDFTTGFFPGDFSAVANENRV